MFKDNIITVSVLFFSAFVIMNSCRKDDPTWDLKKTVPKVQSISVTDIKPTSALVNAKIIHNGGTALLEKGVCFGLTKNPTVDNASKQVNSENVDAFSSRIQNLSPSKTYYVRSYAKNEIGISYGDEISFNTTSCNPSVSTTNVSNITSNSASSGGSNLTDGTVNITAKGVVWSASPNPTISLSTRTIDGSGSGNYISQMTNLSPNTRYYLRAYVTNACTTSYGNEVIFMTSSCNPSLSTSSITNFTSTSATSGGSIISDGGVSITSKGIVWSTFSNPTTNVSTITNHGGGSGTFISQLTGLSANTRYYVRAYATNACTTSYGNEVNFMTSSCNPSVTTNGITNVTTNSATSGGSIISDGGVSITSKGIVWSTFPNPTTNLSTKTNHGGGSGTFISQLTGLSPNTTYYFRAYVSNSCGNEYGVERSFTTLSLSNYIGIIEIGNSNFVESVNQDPPEITPFGTYYEDGRHIYLIRASEIINLGGRAGRIVGISFRFASTSNITINNFKIKYGLTSSSSLALNNTYSFSSPYSYNAFNLAAYGPGWLEFPQTNNPFNWDGVSNIIIETCFDNNTFTDNSVVYYSNSGFNSNLGAADDDNNGCSMPFQFLKTTRPNMRLNFK